MPQTMHVEANKEDLSDVLTWHSVDVRWNWLHVVTLTTIAHVTNVINNRGSGRLVEVGRSSLPIETPEGFGRQGLAQDGGRIVGGTMFL